METIIKAVPLDNYRIDILTSSGISGIFDVKPYLNGSAFKELKNKSYFCLVRPAHHGIMWPKEQDFSSDTIIWDIQNAHRDREEPHSSPLPHHAAYGSVLRGSADQAESDSGEQRPK